jgi:DnaJ family protein C protein 25
MEVSKVRKIFRQMSKDMHPDNFVSEFNQGKISQEKWDEINYKFKILGTAYDTLKDKEKRKEYDHYLDDPVDRYYNYAKFYQAKFDTKVDMRFLGFMLILLVSALQYGAWFQTYNNSLKNMCQDSKFRKQAKDIAVQRGTLDVDGKLPKKLRRTLGAANLKEETDRIIKEIIAENMDLKGSTKPDWKNTVICQIVFLPKYALEFVKFKIQFMSRRKQGLELTDDEKWYMIKKNMMSQGVCESAAQYESMVDRQSAEILAAECWDTEKCAAFKEKLEQRQKAKDANSGKAKQMKRQLKKNGPGKLTELEDF